MTTTEPTVARQLTAGQARRTAIAAQQLAAPRPAGVDRGHLRRLMARLGVLQIDSVNVVARAHLLPLFARLGNYPVELLSEAAWPARSVKRTLVETWAHEASLVPVELYPLLRWERRHWSSNHASRLRAERPGLLENVRAVIADIGPCSAGQVEAVLVTVAKGRPGWWEWSEAKRACEALFTAGEIGTAYRRSFERHYDLIERVLPPSVLAIPVPEPADAKRALLAIAARAYGVGTVADLADYFRMPIQDAKIGLLELAEEGVVEPVRVSGWRDLAYLHREARIPRKTAAHALLCPFDPLIWQRARTERLFDFHYRIEIYTPEPKRVFGYYVFPLLLGEDLVGRFDLKADRQGGRLLVQASWSEDGTDPTEVARAAAIELRTMADWLGLDSVEVVTRGDLYRHLQAAVRNPSG